MKKWVKILISLLAIAAVCIGGICAYLGIPVKKDEVMEAKAAGGDEIVVGIMSDNQIGQHPNFKEYERKVLELFKAQNIDALINAGDYTDVGLKESYKTYKGIYESVYSNESERPIPLTIMGNHDYWLPMFNECWEIPFKGKMQRRFMDATGAQSPWTHTVINGIHFICASPTNGGMGQEAYEKLIPWIKEQIEVAVKDSPDNPVFVITHNNPKDTVYMSAEDGCENLNELYSDYPQVVSISGHSHASIMDEESIYQKNYTAVSTQCLSYICYSAEDCDLVQEDGAFDYKAPMAMIMRIKDGKVIFERYSAITGEQLKEPWELSLPLSKETFTYTDENRKAQSQAPQWAGEFSCSVNQKDGVNVLTFNAAQHPDYVKYYELKFINSKGKAVEFKYDDKTKTSLHAATDYVLPAEERSSHAAFPLSSDEVKAALTPGTYTVKITPHTSFAPAGETKEATVEIK